MMTILDPSKLKWKYMPINRISPNPLFYIECVIIPATISIKEIRGKKIHKFNMV